MKLPFSILLIFITFLACGDKVKLVEVRNDEGIVIERYEEGLDGSRNGTTIKYNEEGQKMEESHYKDGILHGERTIFYPESGEVNIEERYSNGEFDGTYQYFYENGQLEFIGEYENGIMKRDWKRFYENSQLREVVQFENNMENGPFIEYHENGNLKAEGSYYDGDNEHGELKLYNEAGVLERKMECDSGRCQTIWKMEGLE